MRNCRRNGCVAVVKNKGRKKFEADSALGRHLLSPETLELWKGKSALWRCTQLALRQPPVKISPSGLRNFYRRNNVRCLKIPYKLFRRESDAIFLRNQQEWIYGCVKFMQEGRELVYIDESAINLWYHKLSTWMLATNPVS